MLSTGFKNKRLEGFKQAKAQPAAVADAVFAKVNYGPNNILGMSQNGTEEYSKQYYACRILRITTRTT